MAKQGDGRVALMASCEAGIARARMLASGRESARVVAGDRRFDDAPTSTGGRVTIPIRGSTIGGQAEGGVDRNERAGDLNVAAELRRTRDAEWGVPARRLEHWPALLATLVAILLYVTLPGHLYYGPVWLLPAIEGALAVAFVAARILNTEKQAWQRGIILSLIAVMSAANTGSLALLIHSLLSHLTVNGQSVTAEHLLVWSAQVWFTNVIVFGLWYWELDRGGPVARCNPRHRAPDFLFPQMNNPDAALPGWTPTFLDYLYTSFTNAAAFSPTDTLPLTHWAKALFAVQSFTSLATAVIVIARIANILPTQ